jgi:hypothetical protein
MGRGGREKEMKEEEKEQDQNYAHVFPGCPGCYFIARYFILSRQRANRKEKRKTREKPWFRMQSRWTDDR